MNVRSSLKDERPTSNVQHPTSNKKQISNTEHLSISYVSSSFSIQRSMLDVRCSMFIFKPFLSKNNLALMGPAPKRGIRQPLLVNRFYQRHAHGGDPLPFSDEPESLGCGGFNINAVWIKINGFSHGCFHSLSIR